MAIVTNTATRPGARPAADALIIARLQADEDPNVSAPGYVSAAGETVLDDRRTRASGSGAWSLDLNPNEPGSPDSITAPAGSVWLVDEVGTRRTVHHIISVPATSGPFWLGDLLVDPPGALPPPGLDAAVIAALASGIDGGDPSSTFGATEFDGGSP